MDDQIYLVPGEPYQPDSQYDAADPAGGPARRPALAVVLVALALIAGAVQHLRAGHLPPVAVAAQANPAAPAVPDLAAWPQGMGLCGRQVELPQISSDVATQPTGAVLPVTGPAPALVDVDTGRRTEIPGLRLRTDQYASAVVRSGPVSYVLVRSCQRQWMATVVRAQAGRPQRVVSGDREVFGLIGDDAGEVWAEAYPEATKISPAEAVGTTLVRLDRPAPAVRLPPSLNVIGLAGNQVAATAAGSPTAVTLSRLYRYDLTTRRASLLGSAYSSTESRGVLLWTSTPCSAWGACTVRSYDLRTGRLDVRQYHLPLGSSITGGVLSPDGHKLAFALQREIADPYYRSSSPQNPADLVVLDLTDGLLDSVPNLELPPGAVPDSIGFSADSDWLIVALPADGATDIYSWRSGMSLPQLTPRPELWAWAGLTEKQVSPQ